MQEAVESPTNLQFREIDPAQLALREKVGQGITAVVYRGRLGTAGELVAVKQIRHSVEQKDRKAIERELAIMSRVSHDNLVRFIGVLSLQSPFSIITEFCAGGCLFTFLYNHRGDTDELHLEWPQRKKMCIDVASAMHYLHAFDPQIIQRDLKSLNLLLLQRLTCTSDVPHLKVADFGLSRMKDQAGWVKMTQNAGTSFWMAPEVVAGTSYDEKVDVYSYAMVIFEIICAEIPFEDVASDKVGSLVLAGVRPDLEAVPGDCPELLRDLMIRCWAHDPRARPGFVEILNVVQGFPLPLGE